MRKLSAHEENLVTDLLRSSVSPQQREAAGGLVKVQGPTGWIGMVSKDTLAKNPGKYKPVKDTGGGGGAGGAKPGKTAPTKAPEAPAPAPAPAPAAPGGHGGKAPTGTVANETMQALEKLVATGKLAPGMTAEQHVELAKQVIDKHKADFPEFKAKLTAAAPPTARVKGRVKELDSFIGKIIRKPKYGKATSLQDTTGTRIVCDSINEVKSTVAKLKQQFKVVDEDDYIDQPNGAYRSHHLIVEDSDGLQKEIQVRTENQNTFADWCHDIYKPLNDKQKQDLAQHGDEINQYADEISNYFFAVDMGQPAQKPPCTVVIHSTFGCL